MRLSPAEYVVQVFGGIRKTAKAVGRTPGAVSRWRSPAPRGTGGEVPRSAQKCILNAAKENGLDITHADLLDGREVKTESA